MRILKPILKSVLFVLYFYPFIAFSQEGTKQFMPNSSDRLWLEIYRSDDKLFATQSATDKERLYVYLNAGEKMHFGMRMANYSEGRVSRTSLRVKDGQGNIVFSERRFPSSGSGYISSYSEAVTGPEGVIINGTTISDGNGYTPYIYEAQSTGNHYIEFETWRWDYTPGGNNQIRRRRFALEFFDVTVTDAGNNVITNPGQPNVSAGRLWSKGWAFTTTSYTDYPVKADFFVFTADEFVNKVQYEMKPYSFNFVANSYGVSLDVNDNVIEKAQSQDGDLTNTSDISEYRIFLNDPDRAVWQNTALPPPSVKVWFDDNLIYDYDYDRQPQELALEPSAIVLEKNNVTCPFESITMFKIETNIDGFATVLLDLDGNGYSTAGNDKALQLELKIGTNYVLWDFTNDNGVEVADGSYSATATFLGRGPAHFPLYDVESLSGISTYSIRPFNKLGPTLYWDDTQIGSWGDPTGNGSMDETQQKQLIINNHMPRVWIYDSNNTAYNGNGTTMNSWFNAIDLGMPLINFDVITGTTKCVNGEAPVLGDIHLVAGIDEVISFNLTDFTDKYYDPNDLDLTEIQILTLPADGSLRLSGVPITAGQVILASQISNITYTPPSGFGGKYTFEFTASNGTNYALQSSIVNLVSNSAPSINAISDQTICTNEGLLSFPITIGDAETPAEDLTVIAYSHDQNAVENSGISLSGTGASRQLNVVPIPDQSGYAIIYVLVDDGYSQSIEEFALHIGPSVLFTGDVSVCVGGTLSLTAEEVGASYVWKKGETVLSTAQNLTVNNLTLADAGTYSLSVAKAGCAITKQFEVSIAPIVSFTGDVALCVGEDLSLSADETVATSYTWKRGTSVIGSSKVLAKTDVTLADNGSDYTLEVTKEGCSNASAPFTISVVNVLDNSLIVQGSQVVENVAGTVTIQSAEQDVVYTVYDSDNTPVASGTGSDANLNLNVSETFLNVGTNVFAISGDNGNCTVDLINNASITVNGLPTISSQVVSTDEDIPYVGNLLTGATDEDGGNLTAETTPVTPPSNGSVTMLANGNFTYTPNSNFNGSDSFTFRICDDQTPNGCVTADVSITVNAVNDVPVVSNVNLNATEDVDYIFTAADFTTTYTDEEGEPLAKIQITGLPNAVAGELQLSGNPVVLNQEIELAAIGNLKFLPAVNWNGATSFQWKASDGIAYSETSAAVNLSVAPQDDTPSVINGTVLVSEDATNNIILFNINDQLTGTDNDIDGEKISYSILSGNTSNAFKVDANTGEVAVNISSAIDYENLTSYSLVIRATDVNGGFEDLVLTVNVQNSDSDVVLSIANASLTEGDAGTSNMVFTVSASENVAANLSFDFTITGVTATYPIDYTIESGSGMIAVGSNTTTFSVPVVGDAIVESDETFSVALNNLSAGSVASAATGTITDNDNASLAVINASASEGDGQIAFDVTLNGAVQGGLTVGYNLTDQSANSGSDYNGASGTVVFSGVDGQTLQIIVPLSDDNVVEPTETFTVSLSSANPSVDASDNATGSITDNDGQATLSIANQTVDENGSAAFTIAVDKAVQGGFTVNYSTSNGSAILGTDFTITGSSLVFTGTESEAHDFNITGIDDAIVEGSETFTINLSTGNPLVNSGNTATGTIIDDDVAVVTVGDVTVTEGGNAIFTVALNKAVAGGTVITYDLTDNTAEKGVDYLEAIDRTMTFTGTAGESHSFTVTTQNDDIVEPVEQFTVSLSSSNPLVGTDDVATATITDNDGTAAVTVNNISVAEGDNAQFTLTLDKAVQGGVVINYSTNNGTAIAGEDYTAASGSVVFAGTAGETKPVNITTAEDLVVEEDEDFALALSAAHTLVSVAANATATITNDDGQATISIVNASFNENGTGTFSILADKAVQGGYTLNYSFEDGSALAGVDFDDEVTPVSFAGTANESHEINVAGVDDLLLEGPEIFTIRLASLNGLVVANGTAQGTIIDNDAAAITIDDVTVNENETATFTISLDNAVQGGFTVDYAFINGSATGDDDFTTISIPLAFTGNIGESHSFDVNISDDNIVEASESFTVTVTSSNALVDDSDTATGNILDNDGPANVTVADVIVAEGGSAEVVLLLDKAIQGGFIVDCSTADGTATAGLDYEVSAETLAFDGTSNETQSFFIDGLTDEVVEGIENFTVNFSTLSALVNVQASSLVNITDDDGQAKVTVENITMNENGSGTFTIRADKAVQGGYTLSYSFIDGTAIGGVDYNNAGGNIVFAGSEGEMKDVVVASVDDDIVEVSESFTMQLSSASTLVDASDNATATILDDDNASLVIGDAQVTEDGVLSFVVTLSQAVDGGTTVTSNFVDISATGGTDYDNDPQQWVFAGIEGEEHTISVSLTDDLVVEADETFRVQLSSSNVLVDASQTAIGTILNNDGTATVTIADVDVIESDKAIVKLVVDKAVQGGFNISYATANGTAMSVSDYTSVVDVLAFDGTVNQEQIIEINTIDDAVVENAENYVVNYTSNSGLVTVPAFNTITITDNDGTATLAVSDVSVTEGGSQLVTLTVDKAVQGGFEVSYQFLDNETSGVNDYEAAGDPLVFNGTPGESVTFEVSALNDDLVEGNETFSIVYTPSVAAVQAPDASLITIIDEDSANLTIEDVTANEDETMTFIVALNREVAGGLVVDYNLTPQSATAGDDYTNIFDGQLTFIGGANETQSFTVDLNDDNVVEGNETFMVSLASQNALVGDDDSAIGTIVDNDGTATITVADITVNESQQAIFTLEADKAVQGGFSIAYQTTPGTASNDDFVPASGDIAFAGTLLESQIITINLEDDDIVEADEVFAIALSTYSGLVNVVASVNATINDNDGVVTLSVEDISFEENATGQFVVVADKAIEGGFELNYSFADVSATGGVDYNNAPNTIYFAGNAGEEQVIAVAGIDDNAVEADETFTLQLSSVNALVDATVLATATITDDEIPNKVPLATADDFSTDEDVSLQSMDVLANDANLEDGNIVVSVIAQPTNALVSVNPDNTLKLVPGNNYFGDVSFEYQVCDGDGDCASASVTVTIHPVNDAPTLLSDVATVNQDEVLNGTNLLSNDTDPENDELTINTTPVVDVTNGTLVINTDGTYTYTPVQGFFGEDGFTYEACDNGSPALCSSASVQIIVAEKKVVNEAPTAVDDVFETGRNQVLEGFSVLDNDTDKEENTLYVTTVPLVRPGNGTVTIEVDGTFAYMPDADFVGVDSFTYQVCDDGSPSECATATVTISVVIKDSDEDLIPDDIEGDDDPDNDGVPNYLDDDSDGDGYSDKEEGIGDCDNDEVPDYLDIDLCYDDYPLSKGFSPNGDGINDLYEIPWLGQFTEVSIEVFNRWGNVVYTADKYLNDWDGTSNAGFSIGDELPVGTYFYIINIKDTKQVLKGYIYLNR
ncbi:tandem-95 repeat protein [Carboxylicivirga sediminis]|uniref:Tandem-95 repeat protein n=1 Tax=Carboxylicivirga sediminis TaxID=2006564 RepID=A0A941J0V6_9BACT|nr:Calx-beta domain-containing protein [Carboxylicivirga sediminis]MBR8537567.1 tandem-95 repeat protein [Carboxylicivirga sediminis]